MSKNQKKRKKQLNKYIQYSSLGIQTAGIVFIGFFLGDFFDSQTQNTKPIATVFFSLIAILGSLFYFFFRIKR